MWYLVRHAFAVLVLPVSVTIVIPILISRSTGTVITLPSSLIDWGAWLGGVALLLSGGALLVSTVGRFGSEGRGTLAPWDPTKQLVVRGPYAYVRNPMISGVILLLLAEALFLRSLPHLQWAGIFALLNAVYIPLLEEPGLRTRFGKEYQDYCENVRRLIPRLPWRPLDNRMSNQPHE